MYISHSMLASWANCRQHFDFNYNQRIETRKPRSEMLVGVFAHKCLQEYYLDGNWKEALEKIRLRYTGENEEDMIVDEAYIEEINVIAKTTENVVERYLNTYAGDRYTVVKDKNGKPFVEYSFEIPYKDHTIIGVIDLLLRDNMGNHWLFDHKFVKTKFREPVTLELDPQIGLYTFAAVELGIDVMGFCYNQIIGVPETPPKILATTGKNPKIKFSKDKSMNCSWDLYKKTLQAHGLSEAEIAEYAEEMEEPLATKQFQRRDFIFRTPEQIAFFKENLFKRIDDLDANRYNTYMEPDRYRCGMCDYYMICQEKERGNNTEGIIQDYFQPKKRIEV